MREDHHSWILLVIIFSALAFAGCANQQTATSTNSTAKNYSSNDLEKTGKRTSGEALQAADPAVSARGGN